MLQRGNRHELTQQHQRQHLQCTKKKQFSFSSRQLQCIPFCLETITVVEAAWTPVAKTTQSTKINKTLQIITFCTFCVTCWCYLSVLLACHTCHCQFKSNCTNVLKIFYVYTCAMNYCHIPCYRGRVTVLTWFRSPENICRVGLWGVLWPVLPFSPNYRLRHPEN